MGTTPSAAADVAAVTAEQRADALGLGRDSRILAIVTEGAQEA